MASEVAAARSNEYDVVVIGGGPAGSTAASLLSQRGRRVLLLEKESFPRHHVGESLLPGTIEVMKQLGVLETVNQAGFVPKYGATYVWGKSRQPWSVQFREVTNKSGLDSDKPDQSFQVDRSKFDKILLDHSRESGVKVLERCRATSVGRDEQRVTQVGYVDQSDVPRVASCQFCVDASGQSSLLGNSLELREFNESLRNIALYGYFQGGRPLSDLVPNPDPKSNGNIFIAATEAGWIWYIPLGGGRYSVGLVTDGSSSGEINRVGRYKFYRDSLDSTREIAFLLEDAQIESESLYTLSDWSYICRKFYGPGYLLAGDAAAFIDPILSTGVHLAMDGGRQAALAINTSLSDADLTGQAMQWYEEGYRSNASNYLQMAEHWYLGHRSQTGWFSAARNLVDPTSNLSIRQAFVHVAGGYKSDLLPLAGYPTDQLKTMYSNFDSALPKSVEEPVAVPISDGSGKVLFKRRGELEESRPRFQKGVSYRTTLGARKSTDTTLAPLVQVEQEAEGVTWRKRVLSVESLGLLQKIDGTRTVRQIVDELMGGNGAGGDRFFGEVRRHYLVGLTKKLYDGGIITSKMSGRRRTERKGIAVSAAGSPAARRSIGRNDPCPCGSGEKYKRCHGRSRSR